MASPAGFLESYGLMADCCATCASVLVLGQGSRLMVPPCHDDFRTRVNPAVASAFLLSISFIVSCAV